MGMAGGLRQRACGRAAGVLELVQLKQRSDIGLLALVIRAVVVLVLSLAVLCSAVLAVNPLLHHRLHWAGHDSGSHHSLPLEHQCAATLLAKGAVEVAEPAPLLAGGVFLSFASPPVADAIDLPAVAYLLLPGRAPPAA